MNKYLDLVVSIPVDYHQRDCVTLDVIEEWLNINIGTINVDWGFKAGFPNVHFLFTDPAKAAWFTLRWGHIVV